MCLSIMIDLFHRSGNAYLLVLSRQVSTSSNCARSTPLIGLQALASAFSAFLDYPQPRSPQNGPAYLRALHKTLEIRAYKTLAEICCCRQRIQFLESKQELTVDGMDYLGVRCYKITADRHPFQLSYSKNGADSRICLMLS